jgi:indolepyruvate ferredoxin oxidoreductase beta subunit
MEALRYVSCLNEHGWVVTSSTPYKNIPNYPDEQSLSDELNALSHVVTLDIEQIAKDVGTPKSANVVLLGMAARNIEILSPEELREAIRRVFAAKGEKVVEANLKAFDMGLEAVK